MSDFGSGGGDHFSETSEIGWFQRIKSALVGVIFGLLLFAVSFPLLFWNEGRAVRRAKDLETGRSSVVAVQAGTVDPASEGKLVHLSGEATAPGLREDSLVGVRSAGLKLVRSVEMYQWDEDVKTEREKKLGGKEEERKTYTYKTQWSSSLIDSDDFRNPNGHTNPDRMPFESETFVAPEVKLGAFTLTREFVEDLDEGEPLALRGEAVQGLTAEVREKARVEDTQLYLGENSSSPRVGDVRIRYEVVKPAVVSVVGQQSGSSLVPYQAEGMDSSIALVEYGTLTAAQMFTSAEQSNTVITWVLRVVGFVVMMFGLLMLMKPVAVLADVVPFLGSLVEMGSFLVSLLVAAPLSMVTIAVAWVFYRPLLAVGLLVVAGGLFWAFFSMRAKRAQERASPPDMRRAA
jgi:hypothetical protein